MSAEREHVVDDLLCRLRDVLALRDHYVFSEGNHAVVGGVPRGDSRDRNSRDCEWFAAHRPAAVEQQTQRGTRLSPPAHTQTFRLGQHSDTRLGQHLETRVDVEISGIWLVRLLGHLSDASRARPASVADVEHEPPRKSAGEVTQLRVGGTGEIGKHAERLVWALAHRIVDCCFVDLADLG